MKDEYTREFDHLWRAFAKVVSGFDEDAWCHTGHGVTVPARLACHILQSTRYYIQDTSTMTDGAGNTFDLVCGEASEESLPTQEDILFLTEAVKSRTAAWLHNLDLDAGNPDFPWTGTTAHSVVLFLLKHSIFHLGELNALLNEQLRGGAPDHFAHSL